MVNVDVGRLRLHRQVMQYKKLGPPFNYPVFPKNKLFLNSSTTSSMPIAEINLYWTKININQFKRYCVIVHLIIDFAMVYLEKSRSHKLTYQEDRYTF